METGKPQSVSALLYGGSVAVPTERKMGAWAPMTAVYIQAVPAPLPPQQLFPQARFPVSPLCEPATPRLDVPPLYTKDILPFLTVHIAGGLQPLRQELSLATAAPLALVVRPKSAGKHVCPHCSRDCMKPSVLEKHLRCHTGERPYPCATCRVSFKTQSNLYKHKRTQAHARLSSESEHGVNSSVGSQESLCGSSMCSLSLDSQVEEESGNPVGEVRAFCTARLIERAHCGERPGADPEQGPTEDLVQRKIDLSTRTQKTEAIRSTGLAKEEVKGKEGETKKLYSVMPNRHLPLQRQEATLIFKEWEGSTLRGKPQSHESTDSGFSESTDHNMDALPECILEPHQRAVVAGLSQNGTGPRDRVSVQEQRSLEEHISKLISENSVVVEDKQLENMRPRKTMLSKQGSIDLPMPYTYKDSFHFDMRNNPTPNTGLHGHRRPVLQSSLQPRYSASTEQAPLTRSSSLPYSITLLTPEQSNHSFSHPRDEVNLIRSGSSGSLGSTAVSGKSVDRQVPSHHPLVRQTAVDCNHAAEGPILANSSAERPLINSDLSCDGGGGDDICGEQSDRKRPRKKAQKFTYNKWYAYKGGTFKKLYSTTKRSNGTTSAAKDPSPSSLEHSAVESAKSLSGEHSNGRTSRSAVTIRHPSCLLPHSPPLLGIELDPKTRGVHQACSSPRPPALLGHVSMSTLRVSLNRSSENHSTDIIIGRPVERLASIQKHNDSILPPQRADIPSDRKKQRTDDSAVLNPPQMEADSRTLNELSSSVTDPFPTQNTDVHQICQPRGGLLPQHISVSNEQTSVKPPASVSLPPPTKTSFLPKYQLKLPTATEANSAPSPHTLKMSKRNNGCGFATSVSSSSDNQPSIVTSTPSGNECTLQPWVLSGNPQNTEETNSTETVKQCESLATGVNHVALAVSQRHCTTITTATATMRVRHKELCSPTVIQTSPFKPVMAPHTSQWLSRPVLQNQSTVTLTTEGQNGPSASLSPSDTTFTTFSQGRRPNLSHMHPLHTLPSLGQLNRANLVSAGHKVADLPFQILPFDPGQLDPVQKVFHVQTADLQICLQIISDEQLALIEPRMEKQADTSENWKKKQIQALDSIVPLASVTDMVNMELLPSSDRQYTKFNSEGQTDVSQAQVSGNANISWSIQPPIQPHSESNHNTAVVKPDRRITLGESDHSSSVGLAAKEMGDVTPLFPGKLLQGECSGSKQFPLIQRTVTFNVETAKLNERVCAHTASQGGEARPLPQQGSGDLGSGDLVDPGPGHSATCLQPGCSPGVPLIHSSSSHNMTLCDTPAGLARPQPSGTHGSSSLVGALRSKGCRSSHGPPDGIGPGPKQKSRGPGESQQCVEEVEENTLAVAWRAQGLPALPRSQTRRGMSAGRAARPTNGASLSHLMLAGGVVVSESNPLHVQAPPLHQNPIATPDMTSKPAPSARDTVSAAIHAALTHSSDICCPTTQSPLSAMEPSPWDHLPEPPQMTPPAHTPNNSNSSSSAARMEEDEQVRLSKSCTYTELKSTVEGGGPTQEHVAYCGDPLREEGEDFPGSRYHHHQQEQEDVVLSEAHLGGHPFTEGSSITNVWPLLPNCQGYQQDSSSDDDDEGKLIIEL
ncbi:hypothetical protein NHX12_030438 [Muraenolepis orangiensis]|uniref:C2H2-type domain-containing protein n=1 Tax=Muraenolepis orangiensis TaxID=630683 RepID=A0A9Q0E863_9TELE|nr:hypothetical protein NHX12_030438 [Muraenolepis orangiensis]